MFCGRFTVMVMCGIKFNVWLATLVFAVIERGPAIVVSLSWVNRSSNVAALLSCLSVPRRQMCLAPTVGGQRPTSSRCPVIQLRSCRRLSLTVVNVAGGQRKWRHTLTCRTSPVATDRLIKWRSLVGLERRQPATTGANYDRGCDASPLIFPIRFTWPTPSVRNAISLTRSLGLYIFMSVGAALQSARLAMQLWTIQSVRWEHLANAADALKVDVIGMRLTVMTSHPDSVTLRYVGYGFTRIVFCSVVYSVMTNSCLPWHFDFCIKPLFNLNGEFRLYDSTKWRLLQLFLFFLNLFIRSRNDSIQRFVFIFWWDLLVHLSLCQHSSYSFVACRLT